MKRLYVIFCKWKNNERGARSAERGTSGIEQLRVPSSKFRARYGFTLLELLLAVSILAVVSSVTYLTFSTVTRAWKKGMALSDDLHHGDFVMDQLVMGLRSAYYAGGIVGSSAYGFWTEDNGNDEYSSDVISWVKLGSALVGKNCPFAESPHRVKFSIEEDKNGKKAVAVRTWRLHGQPEGFDPEELEPVYLSRRVTGFNCRSAYLKIDDEIDWMNEWENTNKIPTVLELTLWLEPLDEGERPVEIKRIVGIPTALLCWK